VGQELTVFVQNLGSASVSRRRPVTLVWDPAHTFGLAATPRPGRRTCDARRSAARRGRLRGAVAIATSRDTGSGDRQPAEPPARRPPLHARTCCCCPGCLARVFFVVPIVTLLRHLAADAGAERRDRGVRADVPLRQLRRRRAASTPTQFGRSFVYAGVATACALLIGYPLAYMIAFRPGGGATCCWCSSSRRSSQLHPADARLAADPRRGGVRRQTLKFLHVCRGAWT
jgi:hypothetical protein